MHLLTEFVSLEDIENTLTNKIIYLEMKILTLEGISNILEFGKNGRSVWTLD